MTVCDPSKLPHPIITQPNDNSRFETNPVISLAINCASRTYCRESMIKQTICNDGATHTGSHRNSNCRHVSLMVAKTTNAPRAHQKSK